MKRVLYIVVALILLAGCKKHKPLPEPVIDEITMEEDKYQLDYKGQTLTLEFETNAEYSFEIGDDWITLLDDSRAMVGYSQSFVVAENNSADTRSTYIKIIAGKVEYTVTVEQAGCPELFNLIIRHSTNSLDSPEWVGEKVEGYVDWGDGCEDTYSEGVSHDYTSEGKYSATFEMEGVDGFEIKRLGDIEHLGIAF
ncbi:MAG: BACON domain-containing protein [Alistipes sp.]|nr:BACON domain-containing protein [Alistipes sp.]